MHFGRFGRGRQRATGNRKDYHLRSAATRMRTIAHFQGTESMTQHGYLRQPSLQGDTIVFVCDDDLWRVDGERRHRAAPDGGPGRAGNAGAFAGWQVDRLCRPRRAESGSLFDARAGRSRAAHDVAGAGCPRARMDAGGSHPVRHDARATVLPQLPRVHAFRRRRTAGNAPVRPGQSSGVRTGRGQGDRPQHRRSRALEALSRRHGRASLGRRDRRRQHFAA